LSELSARVYNLGHLLNAIFVSQKYTKHSRTDLTMHIHCRSVLSTTPDQQVII